jgi:hypothetical protein
MMLRTRAVSAARRFRRCGADKASISHFLPIILHAFGARSVLHQRDETAIIWTPYRRLHFSSLPSGFEFWRRVKSRVVVMCLFSVVATARWPARSLFASR